jgi:hypothetical protein
MKNDRNKRLIERLKQNAHTLEKNLKISLDSFEIIKEDLDKTRMKMTEDEKEFFDQIRNTMTEAFVNGDLSSIDKLKKHVEQWQIKNQSKTNSES